MMKTKRRPKAFATTHSLPFEVADYPNNFCEPAWKLFRIGTCHGLWRGMPDAYELLAIQNDHPGNGHFEDVLEWFRFSAERDRKMIRIREVGNPRFKRHLLTKRGFVEEGEANVVWRFDT